MDAILPRQLKLRPLIVDNPFKPPIIPERMVWTASAVKLFRQCKRKFYWKYILRLRPRRKEETLLIGSLFHLALLEWYQSKRSSMKKISARNIAEARKELVGVSALYDQEEFDEIAVSVAMLEGMLNGYADVYRKDREEWQLDPKLVEAKFLVNMGDFDYAGSIDVGHQDFIVEHKTASKINEHYIDRLALDTQVRGYVAGARYGLGLKPKRVIYNVTRKCQLRRKSNESHPDFLLRIAEDYVARPEFYFWRESLMFSLQDIDAWEHEVRQVHTEFLHLIQDAKDPLDPRAWGIDDSQCNAWFRMCPFHNLCTKSLDRGMAINYEQGDTMHEELEDKEAAA